MTRQIVLVHGRSQQLLDPDRLKRMITAYHEWADRVGALPPFDHPHIYIDMGDENEVVCAYCSTLFRFDPALRPAEARPAGVSGSWAEEGASGPASVPASTTTIPTVIHLARIRSSSSPRRSPERV